MKTAVLSALLFLFICQQNFSQSLCFARASYSLNGGFLTTLQTEDFNGDGLSDVAHLQLQSNNIHISFSTGNGFHQTDTILTMPGVPEHFATGDFNNDNRPDIAVADSYNSRVGIFFAGSNGCYTLVSFYTPVVAQPFYLNAADVNNDGKLDLVVSGTDTVGIYLGNAQGAFFASGKYKPSTGVGITVVADFNNDGKKDLAIAGHTAITIYQGNGLGTFSFVITPNNLRFRDGTGNTNLFRHYMSSLSLNSDNLPDLAGVDDSSVVVAIGNGNFTFNVTRYTAPVAGGFRPYSIAHADFNNDGKEDLVAGTATDLAFFPNSGSGVFGTSHIDSSSYHQANYTVFCTLPVDLNHDGRIDLVTGRDNTITSPVLLNCSYVGIETQQINISELLIYPNPANEIVSVTLTTQQAGTIKLINALGQAVQQQEVKAGDKSATIVTYEIPDGMYLLQLESADGLMSSRRIIIGH